MKKILLKIAMCLLFVSCSNDDQNECIQTNKEFIKCNIQDNIIFLNNDWIQNLNLDSFTPINWIGIDAVRYRDSIKIYSSKKIKKVVLIDYNYNYSINYGNGFEVCIYSNELNDYRDNTDILKLNVTYKSN